MVLSSFYIAYEIRMIEDDDDDFLPNMDFAGFDDKLNIFKSGHKDFSITERNDYDPTKGIDIIILKKSHSY